MAVDANVLVFARIREEIASGTPVDKAIGAGYNKALSAILDGNITTLIAAVVLYIMGIGSIKGFALTLGIGIVLSMFTAITLTQFMIKNLIAANLFKNPKIYGINKLPEQTEEVTKLG